jgi:nucleotide-binding universal stress UspA family protein
MSKPILVGYNPRTEDYAPVAFGAAVARLTGARLIVASAQAGAPVLPVSGENVIPYGIAQSDEDLLTDCTDAIERIEAELRTGGVTFECRKLSSTSAAKALHEAADELDAGLLVVGSSRRSAPERVLLGSTAERLLHGAPCPVAVVPRSWDMDRELSTIGVGYVDSEEGREALRGAYALAQRAGAALRVITVLKEGLRERLEAEPSYVAGQFGKDFEDVEGEHMLEVERAARRAVEELGGDVPVEVEALVGHPAEVLIDASQYLDLLVCGSRGYGPMRSVLLGSVSRQVMSEARCPLIVLPRGVKASLEALLAEAPGAAAPA